MKTVQTLVQMGDSARFLDGLIAKSRRKGGGNVPCLTWTGAVRSVSLLYKCIPYIW